MFASSSINHDAPTERANWKAPIGFGPTMETIEENNNSFNKWLALGYCQDAL